MSVFIGILPDSPPDSGSEHCQLSPHYALSPPDLDPGHGDAVDTVANITLYNDPVLFQGQSQHTILTSQIKTQSLWCDAVVGFCEIFSVRPVFREFSLGFPMIKMCRVNYRFNMLNSGFIE